MIINTYYILFSSTKYFIINLFGCEILCKNLLLEKLLIRRFCLLCFQSNYNSIGNISNMYKILLDIYWIFLKDVYLNAEINLNSTNCKLLKLEYSSMQFCLLMQIYIQIFSMILTSGLTERIENFKWVREVPSNN